MADKMPVTIRAKTTAAREGTTAAITQNIEYNSVEVMYSVLRPNDSESGGKNAPPIAWPRTYLEKLSYNIFADGTHGAEIPAPKNGRLTWM